MKSYIKNDLKSAYLILEAQELQPDDYQVMMLRENEIPGLLKTAVRYIDSQKFYYYDIGGKSSLLALYEKSELEGVKMKRMVEELIATTKNVQRYMLDETCILLEPEYIFCDREHYYFCYCPSCQQDAKEAFHRLTEFLVQKVSYKDEEGVHFAYTLHKATMEDNYNIEEILERFYHNAEKEEAVYYSEAMEACSGEELILESSGFLEKAKKFLGKVKLLYFEEEDEDL